MPTQSTAPGNTSQPPSTLFTRIRELFDQVLGSPEPAEENAEAIPEAVVTLLLVFREEPKLAQWLRGVEALPPMARDQVLQEMSSTFRQAHEDVDIADSVERLRNPKLFQAFCQTLREKGLP